MCHYLVKNINISQHANETFYTGETLYHILMSNIFIYETKLLVSALKDIIKWSKNGGQIFECYT